MCCRGEALGEGDRGCTASTEGRIGSLSDCMMRETENDPNRLAVCAVITSVILDETEEPTMTTHSQTRQLLPVHGLGGAAAALIAVAAIARAVTVTNAGWTRYGAMQRVGGGVGLGGYADSIRAIKASIIGMGLAAIVLLVAGVVFLLWLYRARVNAEMLAVRPQRLGRGWTVGAWFVPLGNIVLPPLVVADVWRASSGRSSGLVAAWWTAVLGAWALDVCGTVSGVYTKVAAVAFTIEAAVTLIAAGLLMAIIREISRAQGGTVPA